MRQSLLFTRMRVRERVWTSACVFACFDKLPADVPCRFMCVPGFLFGSIAVYGIYTLVSVTHDFILTFAYLGNRQQD